MRTAIVLVTCCIVGTTGRAQLPDGAGRITGTVRSASDSAPLAHATVVVKGSWKTVQTNDSGAFAFNNVSAGLQRLEVRKLGFRAADTTVQVSPEVTASVDFRLTPLPQRLAEVEVRGRKIMIPAHLQAVHERANRNHGALITAEDIRRRNPLDTKAMFEGIAGVHVMNYSIIFVRCSNPTGVRNPFLTPPRMHVYVNGDRATVMGDPEEAYATIQSIHPSSIQLMEVYGGVARIPAEYLADACAVVAIWTKGY